MGRQRGRCRADLALSPLGSRGRVGANPQPTKTHKPNNAEMQDADNPRGGDEEERNDSNPLRARTREPIAGSRAPRRFCASSARTLPSNGAALARH